jgi:hypothetical protein
MLTFCKFPSVFFPPSLSVFSLHYPLPLHSPCPFRPKFVLSLPLREDEEKEEERRRGNKREREEKTREERERRVASHSLLLFFNVEKREERRG